MSQTKNLNLFVVVCLTAGILSCATHSPEWHYNQAIDAAQRDRVKEAKEAYQKALVANPGLVQANNNLGVLYLRQGQLSEAERAFKAALASRSDYVVAIENLANTYEAMGGHEQQALTTWKAAYRLEGRPEVNQKIDQRIKELEGIIAGGSKTLPDSPAVAILAPLPGETINTEHVQVIAEGSSPVGIDRIALLINGQPFTGTGGEGSARGIGGIRPGGIQNAGGANQPVRFDQVVPLRAGPNEIQVVAYDTRGGSTTQSVVVNVAQVAATSPIEKYYGKSWGVVIGINRYEYWPGLEYAVSDAKAVGSKLKEMGFDEIITLTDAEATRIRILNLLGTELPRRVAKDDRVVFFFAGHGQTEDLSSGRQKGYLIPVDGSVADYFTTAISMEQVREFSERIPAKHIYYAMDACYSGLGFTRSLGLNPNLSGYLQKVVQLRSVQMITAGGKGEQAVERNGHGLFTEYFLRALDGEADSDADGVVTATELGGYMRPRVSDASENQQTPQYGRLDGEGEVIFIPPSKPK